MSLRIPLVDWRNPADSVRRLAGAIGEIADGRSNGVGSVTLDDGATTTVVADRRIGTDTVISFMPTTANAAAEVGAGGMYVGTVTEGSFTITHANNAQTDRTFTYCLQG